MIRGSVRVIRATAATIGVSTFIGAVLIPKWQSGGATAVGELLLMVCLGCAIGWGIRNLIGKG